MKELASMGIYGDASILATEYVQTNTCSPEAAWKLAMRRVTNSLYSQEKSCPKGAYLGLCQAGVVTGISAGEYTHKNNRNGQYALRAFRILQSEPKLASDKATLWLKTVGPKKPAENGQLDVVISLWTKKLLNGSNR